MNNYKEIKVKEILEIVEKDKEIVRRGGWDKHFSSNYPDLHRYVIESTNKYFSKYGFDFDFPTRLKFMKEDRIEPIVCKGCHEYIFLNVKLSHKWQWYHGYSCRKLDKKSFTLNKEKYRAKTGYDHPMHNPEVRRKHEEHNVKTYKSKYFFSSEEGKSKLKKTWNATLGVDNPSKSPKVTKKISVSERKTHYFEHLIKDPYVEALFSFEEYCEFDRGKDMLKWKCKRCGREFFAYLNHGTKNVAKSYARCPHCFPLKKYNSTEEFVIADWLSSLTSSKVYHRDPLNRNTIDGELDIFIPNLKFAIEYNGVYWHSEKFRIENHTSNRYSIFEKTKQREDKGIVLFHIYEDEWLNLNTRRKIESVVKKILFEREQLYEKILDKERIELPRDKFSLLLQPVGFEIESIKEPWLEKHLGYEILNAGSIIYRKCKYFPNTVLSESNEITQTNN